MNIIAKIKNIFTTRKYFLKNKKILILFFSSLFLNLISWVYIFLNIKMQSDPIFLHYNIYYGVDLIGNWYQIYIYIPLISIVILFINFLISYILFKRSIVLSYLVLSLNIFLQMLTLTSTYLIVQQNT